MAYMERNEKVSTLFFTHLYASIELNSIPDLVTRLSEDFFVNCDIQRTDDLSYIVSTVIYNFFDYYLSYKINIIIFDEHYEISFENFDMLKYIDQKDYVKFMETFLCLLSGLVDIISKDVVITDITNENVVKWSISKKENESTKVQTKIKNNTDLSTQNKY